VNEELSLAGKISDEFERVLILTLEMFAGETVNKQSVKENLSITDQEWVGAEISLDGDDCSGCLSFYLTPTAAISLTNAMLGIEISDVTSEVQEAICEVTNILAGSAKANLSTLGLNPDLATPFPVDTEKEHKLLQDSKLDCINLFFNGLQGRLALNVSLLPLS
jgi:CheY-specific phosphatase CheX